MKLRAHVETIPPDNSGTHETKVREVEVEAATYEVGRPLLDEQLKDGERIITIRVADA
ncbi:hypothetical protein ACQFYA_20955 [Promicromonospora sp. Marseille-Q5078]